MATAIAIAALRATVLGDCGVGSSNDSGCCNSRGKDDGNGGNSIGDNCPCRPRHHPLHHLQHHCQCHCPCCCRHNCICQHATKREMARATRAMATATKRAMGMAAKAMATATKRVKARVARGMGMATKRAMTRLARAMAMATWVACD